MRTIRYLVCLCLIAATSACGGNPKPVLSPIGQTAATGSKLVQANDLALTGLDALTDQGVISKDAMKAIIRGSDYVAKGSKSLVVALRSCTSTPANCADVQSAITAIRSGLNDGLKLIPEGPAKEQVKAILQPVFDLLLEIFTPTPSAALRVCIVDGDRPLDMCIEEEIARFTINTGGRVLIGPESILAH